MTQKVLLADDNLAVQKLVELTLRKEGYEVTSSDNGLSALDIALKETPDLILADFNLEGLDIYSFVQKTRKKERLSVVPIVLLVNSTESYDPSRLKSAGVHAFLQKPIDSRVLVEEVKKQTAAAESSAADPNLSSEEEAVNLAEHFSDPEEDDMKIEDLLGWSSPGSIVQGEEAKGVPEQEGIASVPPTGSLLGEGVSDQVSESSLEETQFFQAPPIDEAFEKMGPDAGVFPSTDQETAPQESAPTEEPAASAFPELSPDGVMDCPMQNEIRHEAGNNIQEAVGKAVQEALPDMVKSAVSKEMMATIVEKVVWEVVPAIAEIEIKKEIKRLQPE